MSIKSIVGKGFSYGSVIADTVRSGWSPAAPLAPSTLPVIIRVVRVSDFANFAKVGQPIMVQGFRFL